MALFQYSNGSILTSMSIKALALIPVWQGNRIIDEAHVQQIYEAISPNFERLDSGYQLIQYKEKDLVEKTYLIDGQHRMAVIKKCILERDFMATVTIKKVDSEADAIIYFNQINDVKPIQFHDPRIHTNQFIKVLNETFPTIFRQKSTRKPYLSIEKVRESLLKNIDMLKNKTPSDWIIRVLEYNESRLDMLRSAHYEGAERKMADKMIQLGCALACDEKWIQHTL
jgi:hypothetical protein